MDTSMDTPIDDWHRFREQLDAQMDDIMALPSVDADELRNLRTQGQAFMWWLPHLSDMGVQDDRIEMYARARAVTALAQRILDANR